MPPNRFRTTASFQLRVHFTKFFSLTEGGIILFGSIGSCSPYGTQVLVITRSRRRMEADLIWRSHEGHCAYISLHPFYSLLSLERDQEGRHPGSLSLFSSEIDSMERERRSFRGLNVRKRLRAMSIGDTESDIVQFVE